MKETIVFVTVIVAIVVIAIVAILASDVESPTNWTEAALLDKLTFPDGYHVVTSAYFHKTDVFYICQSDDDPKEYRICTPKVEKAW